MPFGAQLPIRLDREIESRLKKVAVRSGTTKSALIRMLAKTFVEQVVADDGSVRLPPNWETLLNGAGKYPEHRPQALELNESPEAPSGKKGRKKKK